MIRWHAIGLKAVRGAMVAAVAGIVTALCMTPILLLFGRSLFAELTLMVAAGVFGGAATNAILEFMKQMRWQT